MSNIDYDVDTWEIVKSILKHNDGKVLIKHHIESFDDFMDNKIEQIVKQFNPLSIYNDYDVVGQFYGEFLKYTGGDKKSLGIVLTPRHITELFSLLANVQTDSKVLDLCAGTGGFLISAMHQMTKLAEDK